MMSPPEAQPPPIAATHTPVSTNMSADQSPITDTTARLLAAKLADPPRAFASPFANPQMMAQMFAQMQSQMIMQQEQHMQQQMEAQLLGFGAKFIHKSL